MAMLRITHFSRINHKKSICLALLIAGVLFTCKNISEEPAPDVSQIPVQVEIKRFEADLFSMDTTALEKEIKALQSKYGEFATIFLTQIVPAYDPRIAVNGPEAYLKGFITHPEVRKLWETCQKQYQDFQPWKQEFTQAFRYLKYYFPNLPTPDLTTLVSEYAYGSFIYNEQSLAIGLDFFLGTDYPYQQYNPQNPNFSQYLTRTFNQDHLVLKTLLPLVDDLAGPPPGEKLIDHILHKGKQLLVLEKLLPETPDSILMEVTSSQSEWLSANEKNIWAFFLSEDLLYNSDWQKIRKYVEYSPDSPGMPAEAPGRTGSWIGWQIAKAYMKKNPQTSLPQLLALQDSQAFLSKSGYKPPR